MEYLYVLASFIFVTVVALVLKSKRAKQAKVMEEKGRDLVMQEQIKASALKEAKEKAQHAKTGTQTKL